MTQDMEGRRRRPGGSSAMEGNERGPEGVAVLDLYERHEPLVEGAATRLMPAVRLRLHRRRVRQRVGYLAVAFAMVASLGGVATAISLNRTVPPDQTATADGQKPGYRVDSSLGVEVTVPDTWQYNDIGCRSDDRPTVVRGPFTVLLCLSPVADDKEFLLIQPTDHSAPSQQIGDGAATFAERTVRVDGVPATRAQGKLSTGRYAGWIVVPGRHVQVVGRTNNKATLTRILDSMRLVSVDHVGCPTAIPTTPPPAPTGLSTFVDPHPTAIGVCFYAGEPVLQASVERTGPEAEALAKALNATAPGLGPIGDCLPGSFPTGIDARLLVQSTDGTVRPVDAVFQSCRHRAMDNGEGSHVVPVPLMTQILAGMNTGVGFVPDPGTGPLPTSTPHK